MAIGMLTGQGAAAEKMQYPQRPCPSGPLAYSSDGCGRSTPQLLCCGPLSPAAGSSDITACTCLTAPNLRRRLLEHGIVRGPP